MLALVAMALMVAALLALPLIILRLAIGLVLLPFKLLGVVLRVAFGVVGLVFKVLFSGVGSSSPCWRRCSSLVCCPSAVALLGFGLCSCCARDRPRRALHVA